jgi:hypothetical protein
LPPTPAPAPAAPAPKPLKAADKKTILGFNKDWTAEDKAVVSSILDDTETVVTGFRVSKNQDYIRLAAGGKSVAWVNKNHVDFPGATKSIKFSTANKPAAPDAVKDSVI